MGTHNQRLIHHFLERSTALNPDKVALIHEGTRATYAEINSKANRLAHWLLEQGIKQGDRIVLLLDNSLEYVVSYYGSLKTGAAVVPLSGDLKPEGLKPLLDELEPKIVISSRRFERLLRATDLNQFQINGLVVHDPNLLWSSAPFTVNKWEELTQYGDAPNPDLRIQQNSLASIIYTSGSTGKPKGAMLSHRNIVANTNSICQYLQLTATDIQMVILPFFYVMGKSLLNTHISVGGTLVINNKFAFPASVLNQMIDEKVTGFSGVPSTYAFLLHRSPLARYRDKLLSLRYCTQAGGHMSRTIKEELRRVLPPHVKIYIMYGATEASARLSYLEPADFEEKMDSIGKAIPEVSLCVLNQDGNELPPGQIGELVASGPNVMLGYWKDEESTRKVLDHRGYHTGDEAYQDEDGYFYVVGRKDHLLKVAGHRINPTEVEDTIMDSGLVMEVAVLGLSDQLLGHQLIALVATKSNSFNEKVLWQHCLKKLPRYKVPNEIKLHKQLPKSMSGKIDRQKCIELIKK